MTLKCDKSPLIIFNNSKITSSIQDSKSNEFTSTQECDKPHSTISNNSKNTSSTPNSNINESTGTVECNNFTSKVSNNSDISSFITKTKSNKCTASQECDKTSSTPKSESDEKTIPDIIESPKDDAYEYMKTICLTFLLNNISFGRDVLDKIQYFPFVQHHKQQFIMKYCREYKILNKQIVKQWYTEIISDKN